MEVLDSSGGDFHPENIGPQYRCGAITSFHHFCKSLVVPGTGLEPAHLTAKASKTFVSAIPPPGRCHSRPETKPALFHCRKRGVCIRLGRFASFNQPLSGASLQALALGETEPRMCYFRPGPRLTRDAVSPAPSGVVLLPIHADKNTRAKSPGSPGGGHTPAPRNQNREIAANRRRSAQNQNPPSTHPNWSK